MTILNFTVEFAKAKILSGEKQRTMRPVRENPNSVWNRLYRKWQSSIYGWMCPCGDIFKNFKEPSDCGYVADKPISNINDNFDELIIPLQIWWQQRSKKIVGYKCQCGFQSPSQWNYSCPACYSHASPSPIKDAHKLCDAVLTNITKRTLGSLTEEEWKADGFEPFMFNDKQVYSAQFKGMEWFAKTYHLLQDNHWWAKSEQPGIWTYCDALMNFEVYIIEFKLVK